MKVIIDLGLVVLFFVLYKLYDIYFAISITMIAYVGIFIVQTIVQRKIDKVQMGLLGAVLILGSATLLFRNELFFKWKPTVVYWILAIILYVSYKLTQKSVLQRLGEHSIALPQTVWQNLNHAWVGFFALMGVINLFVAYFFNTDIWVHFKLFGLTGLMLVFLIGQGIYISRHIPKS